VTIGEPTVSGRRSLHQETATAGFIRPLTGILARADLPVFAAM